MYKPARLTATPDAPFGGIVIVLAFLPGLIYILGFWHVFFMPVALWAGLGAALVANIVLGPRLTRKAQREIDRGMHDSVRPGGRFPWHERLTLHVLVGLAFFGWMMSALWLCAMVGAPALEERTFQAQAIRECKGPKCHVCKREARTILRFETVTTTLCVDEVQPPLRARESIIVRGYFHPLMIRIDAVRRAPAAP
ncbi:hypothetical protein [Massilia mucilaginosa]|nr:hypothetical protein [Massilia mucilaginosa]